MKEDKMMIKHIFYMIFISILLFSTDIVAQNVERKIENMENMLLGEIMNRIELS